MPVYLVLSPTERFELRTDDSPYQRYGVWGFKDFRGLFIKHAECLAAIPPAPSPKGTAWLKPFFSKTDRAEYRFIFAEQASSFREFLGAYRSADGVALYRALAISHFSYQDILTHGVLRSEGEGDIPTFTMHGDGAQLTAEQKTRWLPSAFGEEGRQLTEIIAMQVPPNDAVTRSNISTPGKWTGVLPLGIILKIPVHVKDNHRITWFNNGEQGVRGPLLWRVDYALDSIFCFVPEAGMKNLKVAPAFRHGDLPPTRPYDGACTEDWYTNELRPWVDRAVREGDSLRVEQGVPSAFPSPSASPVASTSETTGA
jgi:hypothetical protein